MARARSCTRVPSPKTLRYPKTRTRSVRIFERPEVTKLTETPRLGQSQAELPAPSRFGWSSVSLSRRLLLEDSVLLDEAVDYFGLLLIDPTCEGSGLSRFCRP